MSRCDVCWRGYCQGDEPCPQEQHEPSDHSVDVNDMVPACRDCVLVKTVKDQCEALARAWAAIDDAQREIRALRDLARVVRGESKVHAVQSMKQHPRTAGGSGRNASPAPDVR